jgi:hypothetical protein
MIKITHLPPAQDFTLRVFEQHSHFDCDEYPVGFTEDGQIEFARRFLSYVAGSGEAVCEALRIEFCWTATGGHSSYEDAFNFDIDFIEDIGWGTNFCLVDEDGEEINAHERYLLIEELLEKMEWREAVRAILPKLGDNDI